MGYLHGCTLSGREHRADGGGGGSKDAGRAAPRGALILLDAATMSSLSSAAYANLASSHAAHDLVAYLNELDQKLGIPIALESPCELTPSLLLAILESLTRQRLPIPQAIRAARDREAKVQAMKIFLGVLESDVLGEDVGLSAVDPRRLAAGEWDEVVFVGEVLCWL